MILHQSLVAAEQGRMEQNSFQDMNPFQVFMPVFSFFIIMCWGVFAIGKLIIRYPVQICMDGRMPFMQRVLTS